jgi:tetratricopeptide (TPR) repeat protein
VSLLLTGLAAGPGHAVADEPAFPKHIATLRDGQALSGETAADPAQLRALVANYAESLESRQYREAETAAKQRIEYLLRAGDPPASLMAPALTDLAYAQRLSENFEAAIQNYSASISLLERSESMLSGRLIDPLRGLGDTYRESGQPHLALPVYERALHLNHVNEGPHNLHQLEILDTMMAAEEEAAHPDSALEIIDRMSALHARRFGTGSEEMLPVLARRAAVQNRLGRHQDERLTYLDVVRIIEDHRGESDVSLIEPYSAIGRTYLHEVGEIVFRSEPTGQTGETFLKRALEVARKNPDADGMIQTQLLIQLADYYTVMNAHDKARRNYRSAWNILSRNGRLEERRNVLETNVPIIRPKLDQYANFGYRSAAETSADTTYIEGYIVARFAVNERGRATDIEVVEADPADFSAMETRVQRTLRESVFRPRYNGVEPVRAEGQLFRHDFLYVN